MSEYDLPELPSDEELGITEEDLEALEEEEGKKEGRGEKKKKKKAKGDGGAFAAGLAALKGAAGSDEAPPGGAGKPTTLSRGPAPAGGLRGPITLLVLLALALVSSQWWALPAPVPANAPDTAFSSARAMTHLVEIAAEAHPPGSPEHDRVRAYIVDELRDLGLDPEVQTTTSMIRGGDRLRSATVRNIVARIPGTASTGTLVLTAHYDGRELSRAAADDGFGVVTILETVRALLEGPSHRNDILVLITDGEELGLLGARAFVAEHPLVEDARAALSVEMRGGGGASIMFETGAQNGWIVREYAARAPRPFGNSLGYEVYQRMPNDTDFTPLKEAGLQGLNFAGIGRAHLYHQAYDAPENVSEATLQHHGLQMLPMTRALADADLEAIDGPDVTYFTVPFWGMVVYGERVVWGISAALLLLFALVLLLVRRRGAGWGGIAAGLGVSVLGAAAAWGVGVWMSGWLSGFHPEQEALHGSAFHSEGWYVLSLTAVAFVLVTVLLWLARRRVSLGALALGAATLPFLGALALTFLAPMAAMVLQLPAAAALLAAAAASGVRPRGRPGWLSWLVSLVMAVPVIVLLALLAEFLWLAMNFTLAPALGILLVVLLTLLLPALDALREPNAWWAPAAGVLAAGVFLGIGLLLSSPAPDRPLHTTLSYTLDRGTGEARWLTQPREDGVEDSADDPARAWAVAQVGSAFAGDWSGPMSLRGSPTFPSAPAEAVEAAQPQLAVAGDTVVDGERRVRLAIRSGIGAELVMLDVPEGSELRGVNGRALPGAEPDGPTVEPVRRMEHWGRPADALLVDLRVPGEATTLTVEVVEHLFRPEELLGESPWRRPPDMAPNIVRASDRAVIRTPLAVALARGAVATPAPTPRPEPGEEGAAPDSLETVPDSAAATGGPEAPDSAAAPPGALPDSAAAPDTVGSAAADGGPAAPGDPLRGRAPAAP